MYQFNFKKILYLFSLFFAFTIIFSNSIKFKSHAMEVTYYSHEAIKEILPEEYCSSEYFYSTNNRSYISFATYKGNRFSTTIKKRADSDKLLYCINYNNSITFNKKYELQNDLYNNELRVRLGIAFYHAPDKWNQKASEKFTTGNFVLDYYMTQIVVHSLIYEFGGEHADNGIDFSKIKFKDNTTVLAEKTKAFYEFCCNTAIDYEDGNFQSINFSFIKPQDSYMYLKDDYIVSSTVDCKSATDNASVSEYIRNISSDTEQIKNALMLEESAKAYDSSFRLKMNRAELDLLEPALYQVKVSEDITFGRKIAGLWKCTEKGYENKNQEVGDLITEDYKVSDEISFNFLVGELILYKKDSVTGEDISDAVFEVLQYNSETQDYEFYKQLEYNSDENRYESGNLYLSEKNKEGKFKVVETSPGKNYVLDWDGQIFVVNADTFIHEVHVENQPVLGKLQIEKTGEQWSFQNNAFRKEESKPLPDVKFTLYAKDDILVKDKVLYEKDKKIVDLITDQNGIASVNDLPIGEYYVCETHTYDDYILDTSKHFFSITRDETRKYSEVNLSFKNKLKPCQIELFKYYYAKDDVEQKHKLPLENVKFGLYAKNDISDMNGNVILKKDTCITEACSDKDGKIIFDNLPYAEYYVKELETQEDFVLNDGIIVIEAKDYMYNKDTQMYSCTKEVINLKQKFKIAVYKTGDAFVGYKETTSPYGQYYTYEIGTKELEKVTFSLFNNKNELIDTQTTNEKGIAEFLDLESGEYRLVESSAPAEYKIIETGKQITLKMDNQEYNVFSVPITEEKIHNEFCSCTLDITKYGEQAVVKNEAIKYKQIPLEGVVFGIYQNFDYSFSAGKQSLPKGSCVGYLVTDANGKASYNNKLPVGAYYLKELSTKPDYDLDPTEYHFSIQANQNKPISIVFENDNIFYNQLSKAAVKIIKTDAETGKKLRNVEFTLYNKDSKVIGVYKTNRKGQIFVDNLPYGKYYFVETKSKDGYYSTNNKYHFTLDSEKTVTLKITNSPILELGFEENYKYWLIGTAAVFIVFLLFVLFDQNSLKMRKKSRQDRK